MREAVLAFGAEYGLVWGRDQHLFVWKYERPLPDACPKGIPRLWLARDKTSIAATFGNQPVTFIHRGRTWSGGVAVDAHVRADLRGKGIGKRFLSLFAEACPLRLMLHSTEVAHQLYLRLGYTEIPCMRVLTRMVPSSRAIWRAGRWMLGREVERNRPAPLAVFSSRLASCLPGCRREEGDERRTIDEFLADCRSQYEFCVVRDWETLAWRYREHPHGVGDIFSLRDGFGRVRAVFALAWKRMHGLDALLLADVFMHEGDTTAGKELVAALPRMARAAGADLVSFAGTHENLKRLVRRFPRDRGRLCSVWLPRGAGDERPRFERWYLTGGDSDYVS